MKEEQKPVFTLTISLDREKNGKKAVFHLKEMDEETFMAARAFIDAKKDFDAVRLIISQCRLSGSDDVSVLKGNLPAILTASKYILEMIQPLEGELKKN